MSDVHKFWQAIATKFGDNRTWDMLHHQEQQMIMHSINLILQVLSSRS